MGLVCASVYTGSGSDRNLPVLYFTSLSVRRPDNLVSQITLVLSTGGSSRTLGRGRGWFFAGRVRCRWQNPSTPIFGFLIGLRPLYFAKMSETFKNCCNKKSSFSILGNQIGHLMRWGRRSPKFPPAGSASISKAGGFEHSEYPGASMMHNSDRSNW